MTRNVQFNFAVGVPTGNQTHPVNLVLTVADAANTVVFGPHDYTPAGTTAVVALPIGTGYSATLRSWDAFSGGQMDPNPPTVTFDVAAPPPPPAPPDPTLAAPVLL